MTSSQNQRPPSEPVIHTRAWRALVSDPTMNVEIRLVITAKVMVPSYIKRRGPFQHILSISDGNTPVDSEWTTLLSSTCEHVTYLQFDDVGKEYDPVNPSSPKDSQIMEIHEFANVVAKQATHHKATGQSKPNVLVHCQGGISRSPACALIMLCALGDTPIEALRHVMGVRSNALPNPQILAMAGIHLTDEQLKSVSPPDPFTPSSSPASILTSCNSSLVSTPCCMSTCTSPTSSTWSTSSTSFTSPQPPSSLDMCHFFSTLEEHSVPVTPATLCSPTSVIVSSMVPPTPVPSSRRLMSWSMATSTQ